MESEIPKMLQHCISLYNAMEHGVCGETDKVSDVLVWQGRIMELVDSLNIPRGAYSRVVNSLRNLGCIELVNRGFRGKALTSYLLHYPPTMELWASAIVKSDAEDLTGAPNLDRLSADIRDIRTQIGGINHIEAFKNLEDRVRKLETAVRALQQTSTESQKERITNG